MNRQKIKSDAKEMIKGNKWTIWQPYLIIMLIGFVIGIVSGVSGYNADEVNPSLELLSSLLSIAVYPLSFGAMVYVLKFVRKEEYDLKILFESYKKFWPIIALYILVSLFTTLWTLLLIIPGMIAALSYTMSFLIMADGEDNPMECIKKSKAMMKGYKWDYFKFQLSFIGWYLLAIPTFGLIFIYVVPYVTVAETLYYEDLRKINSPAN